MNTPFNDFVEVSTEANLDASVNNFQSPFTHSEIIKNDIYDLGYKPDTEDWFGVTVLNVEGYEDVGNSGNYLRKVSDPKLNLSRNFTVGEFARAEEGKYKWEYYRLDPSLIIELQTLRDSLGKAVTIIDGYYPPNYYSEKYNKSVPVANAHVAGRGAKIKVSGMSGRNIAEQILNFCSIDVCVSFGDYSAAIYVNHTGPRISSYMSDAKKKEDSLRYLEAIDRKLKSGIIEVRDIVQENVPVALIDLCMPGNDLRVIQEKLKESKTLMDEAFQVLDRFIVGRSETDQMTNYLKSAKNLPKLYEDLEKINSSAENKKFIETLKNDQSGISLMSKMQLLKNSFGLLEDISRLSSISDKKKKYEEFLENNTAARVYLFLDYYEGITKLMTNIGSMSFSIAAVFATDSTTKLKLLEQARNIDKIAKSVTYIFEGVKIIKGVINIIIAVGKGDYQAVSDNLITISKALLTIAAMAKYGTGFIAGITLIYGYFKFVEYLFTTLHQTYLNSAINSTNAAFSDMNQKFFEVAKYYLKANINYDKILKSLDYDESKLATYPNLQEIAYNDFSILHEKIYNFHKYINGLAYTGSGDSWVYSSFASLSKRLLPKDSDQKYKNTLILLSNPPATKEEMDSFYVTGVNEYYTFFYEGIIKAYLDIEQIVKERYRVSQTAVDKEYYFNNENKAIEEVYLREELENEKSIEGRTSWAKSILNNLLAIKLVINNTVDESTRDAIAIFQSRNNLLQTRNIDFVTERALLEADAIFRRVPSAASIITTAKTKIEDWTKQGMSGVKTKPQHILNSFRDPRKLWAFVLHQMAFKRRGGANKQYSAPEGYVNTGAHFCIMLDGRIIQLHPLSRMIWHGNCVSPRSVAVEFEGNFPNVKGTWWYDRSKYKTAPDKDQPTPAQYEAGRFLASYLKVVVGTTHILAHRQSSDSRENDPGPDIWYNVGEWSMQNLALTDGGSSFKCGSGNPILPEWRTWGNRSVTISNEDYVDFEEEMDWEAYDEEAMQDDPGLIKEDVDENEDFFFEDNEFINTADAIRLNRYYGSKLGWGEFHYQINDFLLPYAGQQNVSLDEEAFAQAVAVWQAQQKLDADGIIGPDTWAKMKAFLFPQTSHPVQPVRTSSPVDTRTVDKIQSFKSDIDSISNRYAFNSNITRGIIAAESGGNAKSGEGTSGYKGLMQAETEPEQLKPAVSIETGIKKFIAFRDKTLNVWLKGLGIPIPLATDENYLRLCLSCYNAGPVTALKAVQYAHAAGDWRQWLSAEFYLRALLFSGGYAQYSTCNKGKSSQAIADAKAERIRYRFKTSAWRSEPDPPAWTSIMSSLNPVMRCWIETKYTNTPGYLEKFIRYFNYFEQNKSVHETEAFDNYLYEDAAIHSHENYSDDEHAIVEDSFFLNEGVDEFDHLFEADEFINDRSKAINLNRHYQQKLGWNQYQQQINDFLLPYSGLQNVSLGEETFAEAVAVWQQQQGLTADGVIGPNTWNRMKISLNLQPPVQVVNPSPVSNRGTAPSVQHIFDFNRWHAQIVLDSMNNGIIGSSFKSKDQLQKIIRGEAIMSIDPRDQLIQALPVISHICSEATRNNYREIIIGSFIRGAQPDGTCGGHCKGRCIDINYKGGSFATAGAVQMVVNILGYLKNLSPEYKKSFGFGLPLQGNFFGKKALKKFKGTSHLNLVDPQLQAMIPLLGIVFPDNDNHLHIQVSWA